MNKQKRAKIVTMTLNPAVDQTLYFAQFHVGQVNRVGRERLDPAGKGINVAKVINSLGQDVAVSGFLGRENANIFEHYFQAQAIANHFIKVNGATRVNTKIVDEASGQVSEINFPGIHYGPSDLHELKNVIMQLAEESKLFVLSGSLPGEAPLDIYREFTEILKSYDCKVFLDTSGGALAEGIKAKPYAIKPNLDELKQLMGHSMDQVNDVLNAVETLISGGIAKVVISLGSKGALIADRTQRLLVHPPDVKVSSTVGAGDAMVAGFVYGEAQGMSLVEQARWATAVAAASVAQPGTQAGKLNDVEKLLPNVIIEEMRV
ncbi:1-phosphofructokinase [Desulfosporosinus sp. OT]|uniref:1-phosphofructokinase n=1 Tax=Desulfosporosinus sp. OT TaxID=913865 RepID=UPI000223B04B|nr:1-phosphofructokinase [Desulfosporosinus sp. OT]EGW40185.1 1-phosphofructokinase [Desulfosporosinus sp. OT]